MKEGIKIVEKDQKSQTQQVNNCLASKRLPVETETAYEMDWTCGTQAPNIQ